MNLSSTKIGPFSIYTIETGRFALDGGAMFGVVPKTLWSKKIPADDKNRIPMAMRCLLIKSDLTKRVYLIDNGAGDKFNEKMSSIYDIHFDEGSLETSLEFHRFKKEDITDIIFTHLHFDHCGGTTRLNDEGEAELVFPNARYWVTRNQWVNANTPNAREKASYFPENIEPIRHSKALKFTSDGQIFEPGLSVVEVNGHSKGQQLPIISHEDKTLVFAGDLIPTHAHVPLPWVMGYDMMPVITLEEKEKLLPEWAEKNAFLYLEHDAHHEVVTLKHDGKRIVHDSSLSLSDI